MLKYKKIAFLFPGQGAQVVGMGKDFYDHFPIVKETYEEADTLLNKHLSKIVFEGPSELLTETRHSQTGIFVTSIALLRAIQSQFKDLQPSIVSGLSLGEYSALSASNRLSFQDCLSLVNERALAMNAACEATQGTMAAVFGLSADEIEALVADLNLPHELFVANFNCPGQTVISGTMKGVEEGSKAALAKGAKRVIPLKVHGAFHSGLMQSAEAKLKPFIDGSHIQDSPIKFVMNVPGDFVIDNQKIKTFMIQQVTHSVRWEQGVRAMMKEVDLFIEMGCGKILAGLNKSIGVTVPTLSINKLTDLDLLAQTIY